MIASLLAIDAGNTRIKWGVFERGKWNPSGALPTAEASRVGEKWSLIDAKVTAIASNVAGPEVQHQLQLACEARGWTLAVIASQPTQLGVTNGYRDHRQLGADRWAGLIAAHHLHRGHKLVVNAGTALTIDALTDDGRFEGGVIVPGPKLMRRSLDRGTAGLRLTEGDFDPLPKSTPDAITSGSVQACVGAIERMAQVMATKGSALACIVISGGAAPEIVPHLPERTVLEENLVLDGLRLIAGAD